MMDPETVQAITNWPTPITRKHVQHLLGFANLLENSSKTSALSLHHCMPLFHRKLVFNGPHRLIKLFKNSKCASTQSSFVTTRPQSAIHCCDRRLRYQSGSHVVVMALVGGPFTPVCLSVKKFSPAEKNDDISNWELLAVKVALEEWKQWLDGTEQPFIVTDHKNILYLKSAKCLNSQARWALFFNRSNFHLSYRLGSKNTKCALSCVLSPESIDQPFYILPQSCVVGALW